MPRGEALAAQPLHIVEAKPELDLPIAQHIGVGCASGAILGQEVRKDAFAILVGKIDPMQRDAEIRGDRLASW